MAIVQISQQVASTAREAVHGLKDRVGGVRWNDKRCTRAMAVGSLITGAVLLARGRRKAGIAVTAAGAAFALLEAPEDAIALWNSIPAGIESGKRWMTRFEGFVEELSSQGERLRAFLEKAQR